MAGYPAIAKLRYCDSERPGGYWRSIFTVVNVVLLASLGSSLTCKEAVAQYFGCKDLGNVWGSGQAAQPALS